MTPRCTIHTEPVPYTSITIPTASAARSLCWLGDCLLDWASGNRVIDLQTGEGNTSMSWGDFFDGAVQSPRGRYSAIVDRYRTKALLLDEGKLIRELNRGFYQAEVYEYPLTFLLGPDGQELIAHCPDEYNRIEIDEVATGKRLTAHPGRKPEDCFHARLRPSPDNRRLLSAGWVWHPSGVASTWSVAEALADPRVLDVITPPSYDITPEIDDATFIDSDRLLLSTNSEAVRYKGIDAAATPGTLRIFDLRTNAIEYTVETEETVGELLWLGNDQVVGFYQYPKLFDLRTGRIIMRWTELATGERSGSLLGNREGLATLALDPAGRRFAVASAKEITAVCF